MSERPLPPPSLPRAPSLGELLATRHNLAQTVAELLVTLDKLSDGTDASHSRDFGRGVAYATSMMRVAMIAPEPHGSTLCADLSERFVCTREKGHDDPHRQGNTNTRITVSWSL